MLLAPPLELLSLTSDDRAIHLDDDGWEDSHLDSAAPPLPDVDLAHLAVRGTWNELLATVVNADQST